MLQESETERWAYLEGVYHALLWSLGDDGVPTEDFRRLMKEFEILDWREKHVKNKRLSSGKIPQIKYTRKRTSAKTERWAYLEGVYDALIWFLGDRYAPTEDFRMLSREFAKDDALGRIPEGTPW